MTHHPGLTMLLVGDVFVKRADPPSVFNAVRKLLTEADFTLGNLEGSVADSGTPLAKPGARTWKADARQITALESSGFDAMTVANNHMLDFGYEAFFETLSHLDRLRIAYCGGGRTFAEAHEPALVERKGCTVAMLGYTSVFMDEWAAGQDKAGLAVMRARTAYEPPERFREVPGTPPRIRTWMLDEDKTQLTRDIAAARTQADIVVCTFHWGVSLGFKNVADYQIELGRHAVDSGADIVFGHHPHVLQGVEVYNGKAIFYSLGNFTFADFNAKKGQELETLIVRCSISDRNITSVEYLPARCNDRLDPQALDVIKGRSVIDLVEERSADFGTSFAVETNSVRILGTFP